MEVKGLWGAKISIDRCCGYCHRHGCYITAQMMHQKKCLPKQCRFLEKLEHPYWKQRETAKLKKKEKKLCIKEKEVL